VGTYDGGTERIFINGSDNADTSVSGSIGYSTADLFINGAADGTQTGQGMTDEVRISNIARSAGWINFEYHNMSDNGNDLTFGAELP
jgi:Concanavalin A-like lectin/glucanases superfamily